MADATKYGNAVEFDVDLHSIYAAYIGLFESSAIDWWDKSWGGYFTSFGDFLGYGWEVMVIVDAITGRPHIAVRREQIGLFARMIRTRFGESLPKDPPTSLPLQPVPTRTLALRRLITISDLAQYRKLALTLPSAELNHLRSRLKHAEVEVAEQLFYAGDHESRAAGVRDNGVGYTWACVQTTWWEKGGPPTGLIPGAGYTRNKGKGLVLEVGMAVVRCANLRAVSVWPPVPQDNYRKMHLITEEWVDKRQNISPPSHPRAYAFAKSHYVAEKDVERIVDATIGALASQENDNNPNTLILLSVGEAGPLPVPSSSTLPSNILYLDVLALEYRLLRRAQEQGIPGTPDRHHPLANLAQLLQILQIPVPHFAPLGNAGNDAFYTVLAFQKLMMAETRLPELLFAHAPHPPSAFVPPVAPFSRPSYSRRGSSHSPNQTSPRSGRRMSTGDSLPRPRPTTPEHERMPGSAPSTVRPVAARAQTIFWDDAQYSPAPPRSRLSSFESKPKLPSSMSSRSVSWVAEPEVTVKSTPVTSSDSKGGSSTKLSLESGSSSEAKVKQGKLKSEKSVKNLAGSLARFWVG